MNSYLTNSNSARSKGLRSILAFTLIEILVVMTLLSVIVLGLLAMFTQTQRAFTTGLTQTDVLESGRIAGDMIRRDLEQIGPTGMSTNGSVAPYVNSSVNFCALLPNYRPLYQSLPGITEVRTNLIEDLFFVYRRNQEWIGVGYFVRTFDAATGKFFSPTMALSPDTMGAGTLYRFETNAAALSGRTAADLYREFFNAANNNTYVAGTVAKIVDGVVHFKVRAFNTNGIFIVQDFGTNGVSVSGNQFNSDVRFSTTVAPGEIGQYFFFSNAVPAAVELEMGLLEDKVWQRFKALPTAQAQFNYLTNVAGRVHVFRQRVQVRNVDPVAYQ